MAEKGLTVRMKTDTSGFKKGMDEAVEKLNQYNKALVDNQYKQRECNKVINDAKKRIKELNETQKEKGKLDENEEKELKKLTETIEQEKVKLSQLRTEQASLRNVISETTRSLTDNNEKWTVLKGTLANLASDVLKKLAAQIVSIGKDVIQTGEQFSASMSEVGAISGATAEELNELEQAARLYGSTTKFSATEAADALKYMALAGWNSQQAIAGLPAVLDLAAASGMDLGRASDIVTDYITAFGLEVEDASKFVDIMSYAMSNSNTTTEMLGDAYKNCAATAKSMGFSVEETTAALMTMANAGVKGGEAGTTLNTLMTRLATNTKGCADELAKYGVQIYDEQGKMHSLSEIMNGLISAFETLTQQEQANLSKMIAGTNQYAGFQTLMQGMSEKVKEAGMSFEDYTTALEQCEGTSNDMAKTMSDNLTGDLKTLQSALDELKLKLFDSAETPLRNIVKYITTDGIAALDGIIKNLKVIIPVIVGAATAMGTLKASLAISSLITKLKTAFDGVTLSEIAATVATKGFKGALDALKADPVIALLSVFTTLVSVLGTVAAMNYDTADSYENASVKVKDYTENLRNLKQQEQENLQDVQAQSDAIRGLQAEYDTLRNKTALTADEKSRLDTVANKLAKSLGISTDKLKDKTGAYIEITGAVEEYIRKLEEQVILENAENGLKEAYLAYNNAKKACEDYSKEIEKQQEIVDDNARHVEELQKQFDETSFYDGDWKKRLWELNSAKKELENQQNTLDNLNDTWNRYYNQAVTATGGIIEYRQEMGYAVDVDKEFEERCDSINIHLEKTAENTEIVGQKTTSASAKTAQYSKTASELTAELTQISRSAGSAADKLTAFNRKLEDNKNDITATRKSISALNEKIADLQKLRDENTSQGSKGYQEYSVAIEKVNKRLDTEKDRLANLLTQQTLIRNSIRQTKDEIQKSAKSAVTDIQQLEKAVENIVSAIDSTQKNAKLLANAEKEVAENGKLTLNTLNSIQKTYPQLVDVTNDYINGIVTEKKVIEELKTAYENDKTAFSNAVAAKELMSKNYNQDFINNTVNLFNEIRDKYDIDVTNFKNAADAKQAINAKLYDEMKKNQQEYDDFINDKDYVYGFSPSEYLVVKDENGDWREATKAELLAYKAKMNQKAENSAQAYLDYTDFQNISNFNDIYDAYLKGRKSADNLYNFINTEINSGSNKNTSAEKQQDKKQIDEYQEKLNLAKAAYEKLVNGKIELLQKEAQAAKDTADAEIAALDRVLQKRKQAKSDEERQKKIDFINAQLRYKQLDEFSRSELQRQKQDLLNEQADIDFERNISAQKDSISNRSALAQNKSQQAIDGLNSAKAQFADHIAYLSGSQTYDQRVANNTVNQNIQIVQNSLTTDQLYQRFLKKTGLV